MSSSRPTSPSAEPPAKRARTRSPSQPDGNYDGEAELVRIKKEIPWCRTADQRRQADRGTVDADAEIEIAVARIQDPGE
jgi:hypothetical protein